VRLAFSNPTIFTTGFPYYVARDQGFYEDAGLQVEAVFTGGGAETVQAVVSGSADIGTETSGPAAIGSFSQGAPIKIISASTTGLDLFWFAEADGPIDSPEDLAGKKVGYSSTGSSSHIGVLALSEELESKGLEPIQAEAIGGPADNFTAVRTGQIAAGWSQPPTFTDEVNDGELEIVARGSEIGEYEDVAIRVNIANARWAERCPETVRRFLEVQERSWDWIFDNQEEAVRIWKQAAELEDSEEVLLNSFDYYDREDLRLAPLEGRETLIEDARRFGFLEEDLSEKQINELFDLSYLPEEQQQ
jgi:NitT/TauT family transport system substrate-binding protein